MVNNMIRRPSTLRELGTLALVSLVLAIWAHPSGAQNLVVNPTFDTNPNDWEHNEGELLWSDFDADGSADSGSGLEINNLAGNYGVTVSQCVPVTENTPYSFGGSCYLVPGAPTTSVGVIVVYIYANTFCSGIPLNNASTSITVTGSWAALSNTIVVPASGGSASLRLDLGKTDGGVDVEAHWDNIFMMSLEVFSDGFENGLTTAWSTTVP